jgi:hypothetical protein
MTYEDVKASSNVVTSTLQMNNFKIHVLFDKGVTQLFIASRIVANLKKKITRVEKWFIIGTPLDDVKTNGV